MDTEKLHEQIGELREQAAALSEVDRAARDRIISLADAIERQVDGLDEADDSGLLEQLGHAVEHFEVEHPRLTEILNRIMVALGV